MKKYILILAILQSVITYSQVFANIPEDQILCDTAPIDGFEIFNLRDSEAEIIDGQQNVVVSYYLTSGNALGGFGAIQNPEMFQNTISPQQQIFTRVDSTTSNENAIGVMQIEVAQSINAAPQDVFVNEMDGDGFATFDLTVNETEMAGGNPEDFIFTYYVNEIDCLQATNAIATPTTFENFSNPQTIYVHASNLITGCEGCFPFEISTDEILNTQNNTLATTSMYPIPANNELHIALPSSSDTVLIAVYSPQGAILFSKKASTQMETIDVSGFAAGIYFVKLASNNNEHTLPFVKI